MCEKYETVIKAVADFTEPEMERICLVVDKNNPAICEKWSCKTKGDNVNKCKEYHLREVVK